MWYLLSAFLVAALGAVIRIEWARLRRRPRIKVEIREGPSGTYVWLFNGHARETATIAEVGFLMPRWASQDRVLLSDQWVTVDLDGGRSASFPLGDKVFTVGIRTALARFWGSLHLLGDQARDVLLKRANSWKTDRILAAVLWVIGFVLWIPGFKWLCSPGGMLRPASSQFVGIAYAQLEYGKRFYSHSWLTRLAYLLRLQ